MPSAICETFPRNRSRRLMAYLTITTADGEYTLRLVAASVADMMEPYICGYLPILSEVMAFQSTIGIIADGSRLQPILRNFC